MVADATRSCSPVGWGRSCLRRQIKSPNSFLPHAHGQKHTKMEAAINTNHLHVTETPGFSTKDNILKASSGGRLASLHRRCDHLLVGTLLKGTSAALWKCPSTSPATCRSEGGWIILVTASPQLAARSEAFC